MRKILSLFLVLVFVYFFSIGSNFAIAATTNLDNNKCNYCPPLSDKPNYIGLPSAGNGANAVNSDPAHTAFYPDLSIQFDVSPYYCRYEKNGSDTLIAKINTIDACSGSNNVCSDTDGCVGEGEDTNPAQCEKKDDDCFNSSECQVGNLCSKFYCVSRNDPDSLCTRVDDGLTGCSCQRKSEQPPCPEGKEDECEGKGDKPIVTNAPLSSPCKDPGPDGCSRIKTAFGSVSTSANDFTRWLLGFVLSISGAIVIIIIIVSGYRLMTSQGDPEKIKNARDQLTAAIVGLLFIIFSLVILELITKDILGLPGFGS